MRQATLGREVGLLALVVALGGIYFGIDTYGMRPIAQRGEAFVANASVSISAAIPSNPDNTLAEQLRAKQEALEVRERALGSGGTSSADWGFFAFVLSAVVLVLVTLNFYLDIIRMRRSQDLRAYAVALRPQQR